MNHTVYLCQYPGCKKSKGKGQKRYCLAHSKKAALESSTKARNRYRAKHPDVYSKKAKKCEWCGETEIFHPDHYCEACRSIATEYHSRMAMERRKEKERKAPAPPKVDVSADLEQRQHDIALERRLAEQCGYGHSPVKSLSRAEIDAIAHTLAVPQKSAPVKMPIGWNAMHNML